MGAFLLALVCGAITLSSFSCGLTGLGYGIIFQTCWSLMHSFGVEGAGDLRVGVVVSYLMGPVTSAYLGPAAMRGGQVRWELVVALAPGTIIAQYAGTAALVVLNQEVLKKMLGLLFFAFALWRLSVIARDRIRAKRKEQDDFLAEITEQEKRGAETETLTLPPGAAPDLEKGQARSATEANGNEISVTRELRSPISTSAASASRAGPHRYAPVDTGAQAETEADPEEQLDPSLSTSLIQSTHLASDAPLPLAPASPSLTAASSPSPSRSPPDAQIHPLQVQSLVSHHADAEVVGATAELQFHAPSPSPTGGDSELARLGAESSSGGGGGGSVVVDGDGVTMSLPVLSSQPASLQPRALWAWLRPWLSQRVFQAALVTGFASGFLNGLFGTGGPPIMMLFAMIEISKGEVRGTSVWSGLLRVLPAGISLLVFGIFRSEDWAIYLLLPVFCVAGTAAGSAAHKHVDVGVVMLVLQCLVLLSTVSLTDAAGGGPFAHVMLVLYALVAAAGTAAAFFLATMHRRFLTQRPQLAAQWAQRQVAQREVKRVAAAAAAAAPAHNDAQSLALRPLQLLDGSTDSYTSWHE